VWWESKNSLRKKGKKIFEPRKKDFDETEYFGDGQTKKLCVYKRKREQKMQSFVWCVVVVVTFLLKKKKKKKTSPFIHTYTFLLLLFFF